MLWLALSAASASLVHRHAVLGGPRDRHRALTRMEESEDARPLMEPARNVISTEPPVSHSAHGLMQCRALATPKEVCARLFTPVLPRGFQCIVCCLA